MLERKPRAVSLERLESRILLTADLSADLSSALPSPVRVALIKDAPETEAVETRSLLVESVDFSIADAASNVADTTKTQTRAETVAPVVKSLLVEPVAVQPVAAQPVAAQPVAVQPVDVKTVDVKTVDVKTVDVKTKVRSLTATESLRATSVRISDVTPLAVDVLKQRLEPTVRVASDEVTKAIEETRPESSESQAQESNQTDAPDDQVETTSTGLTVRKESDSSRDAWDRESAISQQRDEARDARLEHAAVTVSADHKPVVPPLRSTAVEGANAWARSTSSQRSAAPQAHFVPFESSAKLAANIRSSPAGGRAGGHYEQLPMVEGAVFAVALGGPLVRFASAASVPGEVDAGIVTAGSGSMHRVRSRRRRGKERVPPIGMADDLPAPSRAEPFARHLTVATEPPLPKRGNQIRSPLSPRLVDLLVAEIPADGEMQTLSLDDQPEDERSGVEARQAGLVPLSAVIVGGSVAAGTIAMLAYERVLHNRGDNMANKKTRPERNATTRVRGAS